jgi:hypothetical protein
MYKSERRFGEYPFVQVQTNCIVWFYTVAEEAFHEAMRPRGIIRYYPELKNTVTRSPSFVMSSTGRKYLMSLGSKNMYRTVALLLLILKG